MDIQELQSFRLGDAVKFNDNLNPRLWGSNEHLLPEVRDKLMAIADDFREFLGISDLEIKDITISGSNAAYTYTPHSDIDLHLVVDLPKADISDVYRELFDAKKYQYNDQHDYKIGNYDVELYVQDSRKPHHSQGIYSLLNNDWVRVPSRRRPTVDDISVKSKFEDIGRRIEQAIASGDKKQMDAMADKVKTMRQAGLDTTGEFGPENLAFKALRTQGVLDQLRQARAAAKDAELSLAERKKSPKKKTRRWGKFGGMWLPGLGMYGSFTTDSSDSGGDGGGGESVAEQTTAKKDIKEILQPFIKSCIKYLGIKKPPKIILKRDPEWTRRNGTFGRFDPDTESVTLVVSGRHVLDILRTLAHELTHARQNELATMPVDAGKTGSPYEDDANATAGRIMRHWADNHPEYFKDVQLEDYDPDHPPGPESKPTMPAGTVKVDVSDTYDWYKLGQHISNLKGLGKHDFGKGPPSTIMAFGSEEEEHKYIQDLMKTGLTTTDIDPVDVNQPPDMPRQKTDPTYNVNEESGKKSAIYATDVYGMTAYHSKCLEPGCDWESKRYDSIKLAQKAAQKHAQKHFKKGVAEAFDQPYKLRWEKGDHGDVDAYAKMSDGNYLSIMFNKGYSQGTKEEAWSVEFYRNNSQEVTGEGDAYRIFATVLTAMQQFIKKYKPNRIIFAASKELDPTIYYGPDDIIPNPASRAKLYDAMVQRYARAWGFRAFRADTGDKVIYELNRIKPVVAEASGYIPVNDKEARDPRYSMAITQDIKPGEVQRQARKMGFQTTAAGIPPTLRTSGKL